MDLVGDAVVEYGGVTYGVYSGHSGTSWLGEDFQVRSASSMLMGDAPLVCPGGDGRTATGVARATPPELSPLDPMTCDTGDLFGEEVGVLLRDLGVSDGAGLMVSVTGVVVVCGVLA